MLAKSSQHTATEQERNRCHNEKTTSTLSLQTTARDHIVQLYQDPRFMRDAPVFLGLAGQVIAKARGADG